MKGYRERNGKIYVRKTWIGEDRKRHEKWERVQSKSDVKGTLRRIENELEESPEAYENRESLNAYLDKWLDAVAGKVAKKTHSDYSSLMRLYVRPELGAKKLTEIRPLDVQDLVSALQKQGLSARTVRYCHTVLSAALRQAARWRLLTTNPAAYVELPKVRRQEMKSLSPEDARAFLVECENSKHGLLFEFALVTGMRPEEYLALQWGDMDLKKGAATIQRVLQRNRKGGGWSFAEPKTPRSRRTIPFPLYLAQQLEICKRAQYEARLKLGSGWRHFDLVFCSETGGPLSLRNLQRRHFKPMLKRAGLEDIRTYDLRHSCASLLLSAGINPKVVSERLGHSSIVLTLDVYSHVLPSMQEEATEKLDSLLRRRANAMMNGS